MAQGENVIFVMGGRTTVALLTPVQVGVPQFLKQSFITMLPGGAEFLIAEFFFRPSTRSFPIRRKDLHTWEVARLTHRQE